MQEEEKVRYLDLFGIGLLLTVFFEDYFGYILPRLAILIVVIKVADILIEQFRGPREAVQPCLEIRKPVYSSEDEEDKSLKWVIFFGILILWGGSAYLSTKLFIWVVILTCAVFLMLAVRKYFDYKEYQRSLKKTAYKRKRIRFFGKSAINDGNSRNIYLDIFGIGSMVIIFKAEWFGWIMLGTLSVMVILRFVDMAGELYSEVSFERYMERKAKEDELKRGSEKVYGRD